MYSSYHHHSPPPPPPPPHHHNTATAPVASPETYRSCYDSAAAAAAMHHTPPARAGSLSSWSTGLCHCMDDPGNSLITCLCPCITFGQIADVVDEGTCPCVASGTAYALLCLMGMACLYSCCYRSKLRAKYDLEEGAVPDCLVHCCCETCALSQEYRELKNRGFDMGIGYEANMERKKRGVTMMMTPVMGAPAMGGMTR